METGENVKPCPEFRSFAKDKKLADGSMARGESLPPTGSIDALLKDEKSELTQSTKVVQEH